MKTVGIAAVVLALLPGAVSAAEKRTGAEFEQHFLTMMPHHHQQATEMTRLCEQKGAKATVKSLCGKMIAAQTQEKQQMESWRQSWYQGKGHMPAAEMQQMDAKHKKHMSELSALSGEKFDNAFLMAMTEHHKDGMPSMHACEGRAVHAELKQLCSKMARDQQEEIKQMRGMMSGAHAKH